MNCYTERINTFESTVFAKALQKKAMNASVTAICLSISLSFSY